MYRRPKFLEELLEIREQMSRDAFYDVDLFAERVRSGKIGVKRHSDNGSKKPKSSATPQTNKKRSK